MNIERTLDRVTLDYQETEQAMTAYIEERTGRKVKGSVNFSTKEVNGITYKTHAWATLEDKETKS